MAFPAKFPVEKPTDIPLSPSMERLYGFLGCKAEYEMSFIYGLSIAL